MASLMAIIPHVAGRMKADYLPTTSRMSIGSDLISTQDLSENPVGSRTSPMYPSTLNDLCRTKVLQRFVEKAVLSFIVIIMSFLLSGCVNWAHVVEHNPLRVIETDGKE